MNTEDGVAGVALGRRSGEGDHQLVALLIAGEPVEADRYAGKLRVDGYTVATASSLERGLELARITRPDLIFVSLGSWAVPALVLLVLRSDHATRGVPIVLVSDLSREQLSSEVGGLRATEQVVARGSGIHAPNDHAAGLRTGRRGRMPSLDRSMPRHR